MRVSRSEGSGDANDDLHHFDPDPDHAWACLQQRRRPAHAGSWTECRGGSDRSIGRLRELDELFEGRVRTKFSTIDSIEEEVFAGDVVIGAVLVPGASAPKLVSRSMLSSMRKGSVIVDVAIDQGGCFETSHPTTHYDPTYEVEGVIHYCVANMPGAVPLTSSQALNNATLPFGLALAKKGFAAVLEDSHLRAGLNVYRGRLTHKSVAESLGLPFSPIEKAAA